MISVQVRAESGEILSRKQSSEAGKFFQVDQGVYPTLVHIVPWGDTAFNNSQVSALMIEIERYEADPAVNPGSDSFDWLRDMMHMVLAEPHRMLWFVGD
ncbi:MAG: hypothetical protein QOH50_2461 [Kribbellaceae bacterium]|jgi:hypothetical protein|nr:hypothetical protein [Kribbellaceae bacterium]